MSIAYIVILILLTFSTSVLVSYSQESYNIPMWIKHNAKWWSEGQIGDDDFVKGIQYLIEQKILVIPPSEATSSTSEVQKIPSWIRNDAGLWANGQVSDDKFVKGIQYLVINGIIQIQYSTPKTVSCEIINETCLIQDVPLMRQIQQ